VNKLVFVSNRLPFTIVKRKGSFHLQPSAGGLATGLSSFYKAYQAIWVGWSGVAKEKIKGSEREKFEKRLKAENCYPVFLSQSDIENFYHGFCNKTIWPLFHYFPLYTVHSKRLWEAYKRVNEIFCDEVAKVAQEDDIIWIHDYHLMLLPQFLRDRFPEATIGFFLHIPFPSFEIFRLLPWRRDVLRGLLGADLIGFHTYDYVRHFLESASSLIGCEHSFGHITAENRVIRVDAFPMGIDYQRFARAAKNPKVKQEIQRIRHIVKTRNMVLSVDRLDYTKGIPQRLEAFDLFLEKNPKYKEKITLVLVAVPSRTNVEQYKLLKAELDELVGKINGKHGTIGWIPVWYLYRCLSFTSLVALYNIADVALITPLRDGMNLIAKEFIASKMDDRGVLILSEMAGAAKELGEAIIINPNNKERIVNALKEALEMKEEEQIERNKIMRRRLQRYNVVRWANDFMDRLSYVKKIQQELLVRKFTPVIKENLIRDYLKADKRLILLDYDGTLISFAEKPERASPDAQILKTLEMLTKIPGNKVVIISGRDKETLEKWFGHLKLGLIAEHGVWVREKEWEMLEPLRNDWKEEIRPILELYVDRTPGSFIEEKEFSLVWHYRKADPELAQLRARELRDALLHITGNFNLGVLEGNKVMEVKNAGINKGKAALKWVSKEKWDFILAIGDDWTDEDVFSILPPWAYSIKVGLSPSKARFNIGSLYEVRSLLKTLGEKEISHEQ